MNIRSIRAQLGLTQEQMAEILGVTQPNVGHYEAMRQTLPPLKAQKLIEYAATKDIALSFNDIYPEAIKHGA